MHRAPLSNLVVLSLAACALRCAPPPDPPDAGPPRAQVPAPKTPRWAFRPWISKDISTGPDMREFIAGFQERDIPVGVAVLDSPWETNYNTLIVNEERYPDFDQFVDDLHADDIRLVVWTTQMVNESSYDLEVSGDVYDGEAPNYRDAARKGYFVNDAELYRWWKGSGAAVDFFNEDAVLWWRAQQTALLERGVDGWKLDFGEQYITTLPIQTADGEKTLQEYSEAYYADFWENGVLTKGVEDFVTMVRPYDASYGFEGRFYARREHSPVSWVGDQFRNWVGLVDALDHIFRSAAADYVMLGSDIGGYLDRESLDVIPFDGENFHRWTAFSCFTPLFQLHGRANLAPWTVEDDPDAMVADYRYWATLHDQLVPFFYSLAQVAWRDGGGILHPVGDEASWAGDWRFFVGDAFLVAPIIEAGSARSVALPAGASYVDWWDLGGESLAGGTSLDVVVPSLREIPVYVKEGAIIPMGVSNDVTGLGTTSSRGATTVLVFPAPAATSFELWDEAADDDGEATIIDVAPAGEGTRVSLSRAATPYVLRVRASGASGASLEGAPLTARGSRDELLDADDGVFIDDAGRAVWVRVPASDAPVEITID